MVTRRLLWVCVAFLAASTVAWAERAPHASARALGDAFAAVVEDAGPATVYIQADKSQALSLGLQQLAQEYALPSLQPRSRDRLTSTGSGVLVSPDGLILTNNHVISGAHTIVVTLWDKRSYPATLLGADPRTDVAVLQLDGAGRLPYAPIGDSDAVRIGHWVLAIGHPFDFQFTVTAGIVSARGRRNLVEEEIQDYIQTDAAVNPGSSGGPLFNLDGEIIGLNTAIFTPEGGSVQSAGISFAIPSNMAWRIAQELQDRGRVTRGAMGVATRDWRSTPGHPRPGAEVTQVIAASPAERAGLRRGDLILQVNDEPIGGSEDLRGLVRARGPDEALRITFERSGTEHTVTVTTAAAGAIATDRAAVNGQPVVSWAGMQLTEASDAQLAAFGVAMPDRSGGVMVLSVEPASPASLAGLAAGDVLIRLGGDPLLDGPHLLRLATGRHAALVHFWRGDGEVLAAIGGLNP